jgi:tRNA nucleotidyltransferase (CCA-adding enzyme)
MSSGKKIIPRFMRCGVIFIHSKSPSPEYLIVFSKKSRKWGFPKGGMEPNETCKETAVRELYEETGYQLRSVGDFSQVFQYFNNLYYIMTTSNPKNDLIESTIPDSVEIARKLWISETDLLKMSRKECNMGLNQWVKFLQQKERELKLLKE